MKNRRGRYSTVLHMHIWDAVIRKSIKKYMWKRLGDRMLFVVWTKNKLADGAFDNMPRVVFDRVSVRKALRISRYYVYWPRFHQQRFPMLPPDEQRNYYGWAERITKSAYLRKMGVVDNEN